MSDNLKKRLTYDEANSPTRREWLEKGAYPLDRAEYHGWLGYHNPITGTTEIYEPIGEPGKEVYELTLKLLSDEPENFNGEEVLDGSHEVGY